MEVVDIKKILVPNLLIHIYLHCIRSSLWCATTLAKLVCMLFMEIPTKILVVFFAVAIHGAASKHQINLAWPCNSYSWAFWFLQCLMNLFFFDEIFIFVNSSKIKMNKTNDSFLFCFLFFAYTDNTICSVISVGTKIKCEL